MLTIEIAKIPPEGLDIDEALEPGEVHLEGEPDLALRDGGRVSCHVDRGDDDTIHVRGTLGAGLGLQCGRCLEAFDLPVAQQLDLFYLPAGTNPAEQEEDVALSDRDLVVAYYRGAQLDLGELVREQLLLSLPMKRLCRPDCAGLCARCGANLNAAACACPAADDDIDPRFSGLKELLKRGSH